MKTNEPVKLGHGVPEAAELLGVSESSIWRFLAAHPEYKTRLGRRVLISRAKLEQLFESGGTEAIK